MATTIVNGQISDVSRVESRRSVVLRPLSRSSVAERIKKVNPITP